MKKLILILLLLPVCANGTIRTLTGGSTYTTQAAGDTLVIDGTSITYTGTAIIISHANILIDGQSDTIYYGSAGADDIPGISVNAANLQIQNLFLIQADDGSNCDNMVISNTGYGLRVRQSTIINNSYRNGNCASVSQQQSYNIHFDTCIIINNCKGGDSRGNYDWSALKLELRNTGMSLPTDTSLEVTGCTIQSHNCGVVAYGNWGTPSVQGWPINGVYIHYNEITIDHVNEQYPTYDGNSQHTSANSYGVFVRDGRFVQVTHNNFYSGTSYGGAEAFNMEDCIGSSEYPIEVAYNTADSLHSGADISLTFPRWGFRVRNIENKASEYISIHDNYIVMVFDTTQAANGQYTWRGAAAHFSWQYDGWNSDSTGANYSIYNNHFEAITKNVASWLDVSAVRWSSTSEDTTVKSWNNYIAGASYSIFFEGNSVADGIIMTADSIWKPTDTTDFWSPYKLGSGSNVWNSENSIVRDAIYGPDISSTDISFYNVSGGVQDLTIQEKLLLYVMGNNDSLVSNANVWGINNYGDSVLIGNTGDTGYVWDYISYWYESRTESDSTSFNDFTVKARNAGATDSTSQALTMAQNFHSDTIYLANTSGDIGGEEPPEEPAKYLLRGIKR